MDRTDLVRGYTDIGADSADMLDTIINDCIETLEEEGWKVKDIKIVDSDLRCSIATALIISEKEDGQ